MKSNLSRGFWVSGVSTALLSVVIATSGCSSDSKEKGKTDENATSEAANWTSMGFDVKSTFLNPHEKKISKESVKSLVEMWHVTWPSAGTPVILGNNLYVASGAKVLAYDITKGKPIWVNENLDDPIGTTASPAYAEGHLYFMTSAGGRVVSMSTEDGSIEWSTQIEDNQYASGYSSPVIIGDILYLGDSSSEEVFSVSNATFKGAVVAVNRKTGEVKWKTHTAGDGENGCAVWGGVSADPDTGLVFAGSGNNYTETPGPGSDSVFAFDAETGDIKWHKQVTEGDVFTIVNPRSPDTDFGANVINYDFDGKKYVAAGQKSGDMYIFDQATGDQVSHRKLGGGSAGIGGVFQALSFDGSRLFVVNNITKSEGPGSVPANGDSGGQTSVLFSLDPVSLDINWERQLGANVWNPITMANGVGFVGVEQTMQAFDLDTGEVLNEWRGTGSITGGAAISNGHVCYPSGISYLSGHAGNQFHCLGAPSEVIEAEEPTPPKPNDPAFSNVYEQVIVGARCSDPLCHGTGQQGNLRMDSKSAAYEALVNVDASGTNTAGTGCAGSGKKRVIPGNAAGSLLLEKLSGNPSCGDRMPPTGDPIDQTLIDLVKAWIAIGAPNN